MIKIWTTRICHTNMDTTLCIYDSCYWQCSHSLFFFWRIIYIRKLRGLLSYNIYLSQCKYIGCWALWHIYVYIFKWIKVMLCIYGSYVRWNDEIRDWLIGKHVVLWLLTSAQRSIIILIRHTMACFPHTKSLRLM